MTLWAELERVYGRLQAGDEGMEIGAGLSDAVEAARPLPPPPPKSPNAPFRSTGLPRLSASATSSATSCSFALARRSSRVLWRAFGPAAAKPPPTFGLAASKLEAPHWSALSPSARSILAPRRSRRRASLSGGAFDRSTRPGCAARRARYRRAARIPPPTTATTTRAAEGGRHASGRARRRSLAACAPGPVLLTGASPSERAALFHAMRRRGSLDAWMLEAGDLPPAADAREQLARAYMREAALWPAALWVRAGRLEDPARWRPG